MNERKSQDAQRRGLGSSIMLVLQAVMSSRNDMMRKREDPRTVRTDAQDRTVCQVCQGSQDGKVYEVDA
jgi:hypothetical protein